MPWDIAVDDAVAAIAAARDRHGDTFVVDSGDDHLFTFSPTGVESFYALPEEVASKGVADYLMLQRKRPDEIFAVEARPPTSFLPATTSRITTNLHWALNQTVAELGSAGSVDLFGLTRELGTGWGWRHGRDRDRPTGAPSNGWVSAFDTLDGSDAFVHPDAMAAVAASNKRPEHSALETVVAVVEQAVRQVDPAAGRHCAVRAGSSTPGRRKELTESAVSGWTSRSSISRRCPI